MATKERYQNPVVGDDVNLKLFAYRTNNKTDFYSVEKVEIYYLDPAEISDTNLDGRRLVETVTDITHVETGLYQITIDLEEVEYVIGNYIDVWYVYLTEDEVTPATIDNNWRVYPELFYTSPIPIVYDFSFAFRPNKIRVGSKRYLIIDITPNVPSASDMARYYENLAICSPLKISIEQICGDCLPEEEDLRLIVDEEDVELREKMEGYYMLDTTDMNVGIYDVWFTMEFGENIYISDKQQLQIYE